MTDENKTLSAGKRITATQKVAATAGAALALTAAAPADADVVYVDNNPVSLSAYDV